jgi:hypothetical protein
MNIIFDRDNKRNAAIRKREMIKGNNPKGKELETGTVL